MAISGLSSARQSFDEQLAWAGTHFYATASTTLFSERLSKTITLLEVSERFYFGDFSPSPIFPGGLFCAVNQFLTRDAVANPGNRFQALGVYLLLAVETLAERALSDTLQRSVDCIQECSVARFLAEVQLVCERRVCAIALVIVMLHSPSFLVGLGQALAKLPVARLERLFESLD